MTCLRALRIWALALAAPSLWAQGPEELTPAPTLVTTYPLRALMGRVDPTPPLPLWSFLDLSNESSLSRLLGSQERYDLFEPDAILELVRTTVRDAVPVDELGIEYLDSGTMLVVAGGRDGHVVLTAVQELERVLARGIVVQAAVYDWSGGPPAPVVATGDQLAALVEGKTPVWSGTTRARSGAACALGQHEVVRYVRSTEGEVAQNAKIGLPVMGEAFAGVGLTVVPHSLIGTDDLVVMCQLAVGKVLEKTARPGRFRDEPTLDAPRVEIDAGTMSGCIANGGALLYRVTSPAESGNSLLVAVRCQYATPRQDGPDGMRAWPISALITGALRGAPFEIDDAEDSRAAVLRRQLGDDEPMPLIDAGKLVDLVRTTVAPEQWGDRAQIVENGGWLIAHAPTNTIDATEKLVLQLQKRWLRTTEVDLVTSAVRSGNGSGPFAVADSGAEERELHAIRFPALVDHTHVAVHGIESTSVRGVVAGVAQESSLARSVVQSAFSGVYAEVQPYRTGDGTDARVAVDLVQLSSDREHALDTPYGGAVDVTGTGVASFRYDGPLPQDGPWVLGSGPTVVLGGEVWRSRQAVQLGSR